MKLVPTSFRTPWTRIQPPSVFSRAEIVARKFSEADGQTVTRWAIHEMGLVLGKDGAWYHEAIQNTLGIGDFVTREAYVAATRWDDLEQACAFAASYFRNRDY